jgi:hypothetical protein
VAQWQYHRDWTWGAEVVPAADPVGDAVGLLGPFRDAARRRLARPDGPPLKVFCSGNAPVRTAVGVLSMVLNGFAPAEVLLFGEYQWGPTSRRVFAEVLPFARVVPTGPVLERLGALGGDRLAGLARRSWNVMKTCVGPSTRPVALASLASSGPWTAAQVSDRNPGAGSSTCPVPAGVLTG